nr:MAG TPA: hypothetical protein [Bacteriophage sp.]
MRAVNPPGLDLVIIPGWDPVGSLLCKLFLSIYYILEIKERRILI